MTHLDTKQEQIRPRRRWSSRWQSLRWRLLTLLGVVLLTTLVLIGASVTYFVFFTEQKAWQGRQGEAARNSAEKVGVFIQHVEDTLTLVSSLDHNYMATNPQAMQDILQQSPALLEIIRVDSNGRIFASAYKDAPVLDSLFTISQSQWFLEATAGRVYLSDIRISAGDEPYLIVAVPSSNGGAVAARLRMNVLWDVVAGIRFGKTGRAYVINQEGKIIAHTSPHVALAYTNIAGRPEVEALAQMPNKIWNGSYPNFEGIWVVGATAPVPGKEWVVITELPQAEAFAVTRIALLLLGGGILLSGILVMALTTPLLGQLIIRPMEQLRAGAEQIGSGDLNHRINIFRHDEVGQVAIAFNHMADRLRDREEELILARDQALRASRFKTELLSKVSHELRTPLGAILGFAEMMRAGVFGTIACQQQQAIEEIIDSTQYLTSLVSELLDQAKLKAGKLKLDNQPFAPKSFVDDVLSKMSVLAQAKGLALTTDIAPDVPTTLCGDPTRLQQILVNLVSNAVKFTQTGSVQIRVYRPTAEHWALQVTDTGPGIPAEAQAYIFEPFGQVDGSATRLHTGTGLGLSIVKQLTTLMSGKITVSSEVGEGSTFTVILPLQLVQEKIL